MRQKSALFEGPKLISEKNFFPKSCVCLIARQIDISQTHGSVRDKITWHVIPYQDTYGDSGYLKSNFFSDFLSCVTRARANSWLPQI